MTGSDDGAESGSVVLRLSTGRKGVVSALRRTLDSRSRMPALTGSFLATASNAGLGDTLLLHEYRHSASLRAEGVPNGLGTFMGVFVPCTCSIFGVVVFLRLGFVVGQAGVWCTLLFIAGAFLICALTVLSLCTLIGDGGDAAPLVPGGEAATRDPGVYCALRKAVGPELGSALGLAFALAFTVDIVFYVTGFATTVSNSFAELTSHVNIFPWNPPGSWVDVAMASGVLLLLTLVCSRGVVFSARASLATLVAILACLLATLLCVLVPAGDRHPGAPVGHTGLNWTTLRDNAGPELSAFAGSGEDGGQSLMLMFVIVFPGFTGMLAGANLSSHLRTPTASIAKGSLASLLFVAATYAAIALSMGASVMRPALKTELFILNDVALSSLHLPIGQIGVCLTTLSSALSYLLGAPRVLAAVARDSSWPLLQRLAPPPHSPGEPLAALACTWLLAQVRVRVRARARARVRVGVRVRVRAHRGPRMHLALRAGHRPHRPPTCTASHALHASHARIARVACMHASLARTALHCTPRTRPLHASYASHARMSIPQVIVITGSINLLAPLVAGLFLLAFTLINLLAFLATLSRAPSDIHAFSFSPRWLSLLGFLLSFLSMAVALANSPPVCTCTCPTHMYSIHVHVHVHMCTCAHGGRHLPLILS